MVVNHRESAARESGLGKHLRFGRFIERQDAELRASGEFGGRVEDARGGADLVDCERSERVWSGGRGWERDRNGNKKIRQEAAHDDWCPGVHGIAPPLSRPI